MEAGQRAELFFRKESQGIRLFLRFVDKGFQEAGFEWIELLLGVGGLEQVGLLGLVAVLVYFYECLGDADEEGKGSQG